MMCSGYGIEDKDNGSVKIMAKIRHGNNIQLTGNDLKEYISIRFPNTCTHCLAMPSKMKKCKHCGGDGMKNKNEVGIDG